MKSKTIRTAVAILSGFVSSWPKNAEIYLPQSRYGTKIHKVFVSLATRAFAVIAALFLLCNCTGLSSEKGLISTDSATIAAGEVTFTKYCSSCHNFRQDGIGPQLSGLTSQVSNDWIQNFIKNPQAVITSEDDRAVRVYTKFRKVAMPSFATLKEDELNAIVAFLHTNQSTRQPMAKGNEIVNPIPDTIPLSNLVVNLKLITQIPVSSDSGELPLTRITKLRSQPNSNDLFILDLSGKLYRLQQNKPIVYMDMAKLKPKFIDEPGLATGFGSFAFHPNFARNGLLYTTHAEAAGTGKADFSFPDSIKVAMQWVLTEWKTENSGAPTFSGTSRELLRVDMVTGIHGVQEIVFNPQSKSNKDYGKLYVCIGDGGSVENGYPFLAHSTEKIWGTILRIDPMGRNSANGQYGIPPDNPFAQNKKNKALGEIYAYGFRNPHRISWSKSGLMLACNIGQANIEAIYIVMPGHDYGWPIREGTFALDPSGDINKVYPLPANDSIYRITYPVAQYDHDEGVAVTGGFEYWGTIPQLTAKYFFGDIAAGRLFYVEMADIKQGKQALIKEWRISLNNTPTTLKQLCGTERVHLRFGRDDQGELYILTKADGKVYRLENVFTKKQNTP